MNKHLNLFSFFNDNNIDLYEDNLSRAFAICLKHDLVFLDHVLKRLLDEDRYNELFDADFPDSRITIDVQTRIEDLGVFSNIIAVACSAKEIEVPDINDIDPRKTKDPVTDVCIQINDTCILFEFKRNEENCSSQLKGQAEKLKQKLEEANPVKYVDFNWSKIIKTLQRVLSLQRQIERENYFSSDFLSFLEIGHPSWFPQRPLYSIPGPKSENDPNYHHIEKRLNTLKRETADFLKVEVDEITGKFGRTVISGRWGYTKEVHIDQDIIKKELVLSVYLGDTKAQGLHLFKSNSSIIHWPEKIRGFKVDDFPYLKFSHFNSGLFWYEPSPEEYQITHSYDFFTRMAGRWKKERWNKFDEEMRNLNKKWLKNCEFEKLILGSNRTYFDLSVGLLLRVRVPYVEAQELDQGNSSSLSKTFAEIVNEIKAVIEN